MAPWGTPAKKNFRSKNAHERYRRVMMVRRVLSLIFLLALGTGLWYLVRLDAFTIRTVTVEGGDTINQEDIKTRTQVLLDGTYGFFIPRRFAYLYPHEEIEQMVKDIPRVSRASVSLSSNKELYISIDEYTPHALWCAESTEDMNAGCLFVSNTGLAFAPAPSLLGSTFLRYVTEGRTPEVAAPFVSVEYMRVTEEFSRVLSREYGMDVYAVYETLGGDVHYRIRGGGEILVPRVADMQKIFENLNSILTSEEFGHLRPGNFSYVDLRFGNKIFVKQPVVGEDAEGSGEILMQESEE